MRWNLRALAITWATFGVGAGLACVPGVARSQTVIIQGPDVDLVETPVVVPLARPMPVGNYRLAENGPSKGSEPIPANVFEQSGKLYLGFVLDRIKAGAKTALTIEPNPTPGGSAVTLTPNGRRVAISVNGQPLTEYIPDDGPKPYFYPLLGPSGVELTRNYPMKNVEGEKVDHPHHRSLWYAHGNVNGVDFWATLPEHLDGTAQPKAAKAKVAPLLHGVIKETSRAEVVSGSAVGLLRTTDDWLDPKGNVVLTDERVVRVYATKGARVFDFDITLKAPGEPAQFVDTKEGTFALRVASSMDVTAKKGGKIVTSEGITDKDAWGKPASWVDYTGPVKDETFGIAILNHPDSFRYPTTWHVRDYGLFAANPFGWHDFGQKESGAVTLAPGETLSFRYRLILHRGDTASAHLDDAFRGYAHPPKVEVK